MNQFSFKYGMIVSMEATPISVLEPCIGLAMTSSSTPPVLTYFRVEKYWKGDADMSYKIRLVPLNRKCFGDETLYISDAERLLEKGIIKIVNQFVADIAPYLANATTEQLENAYKEIKELKELHNCNNAMVSGFLKSVDEHLKSK